MEYLICFVILLIGVYLSKANSKIRNRWYFFEFLCLTLLMSFRYLVGGDSQGYYLWFNDFNVKIGEFSLIDFSEAEYQPLWYLLIVIIKSIWNDFVFLQLILAVFVNGTVFWFVKKYSKYPFLVIIFYFFFDYPYFNMEILRESVSVCFFLISIPSLHAKKYIKYFILCFIAFGFHPSALFLFFIPFLFKYLRKSLNFNTVLIITIIVFILSFFPVLSYLVKLIGQTSIESRYNTYSSLDRNLNSYLMAIINITFSFCIVYAYKIRNKNDKNEIVVLNIYLLLTILVFFIDYFYRFKNYVSIPFSIILIDMVAEFSYNNVKKYNLGKYLCYIGFAFIITNQIYYYNRDMSQYNFNRKARFYNIYYPYHSIWDKNNPDVKTKFNIFFNYMDR